MKDYYDLRYEETDGENYFVEETAYQEKQSEQSKMEDQLMEMVGGSESNVWKLYESIMCLFRYGRNHQAGRLFAGSL